MAISMADYKRSIRCSGCGNEITVYMNGNFDLTELSAVGKCPDCRSTIQLDFAMVEKEAPVTENAPEETSEPPPMDMFSAPQQTASPEEEEKPEEEASNIVRDLMKD
jgi:DNA-directed RNA polymerase subunit RPC12/RpoP